MRWKVSETSKLPVDQSGGAVTGEELIRLSAVQFPGRYADFRQLRASGP